MKFEATLRGRVVFERKFTVFAKNEEDAAEIAEEMFRDNLKREDECEVDELYIEPASEDVAYEIGI